MSGTAGARRGVLGGAFNPPHIAHLIVARVVCERCDLDDVVLIPTSSHALKDDAGASARDRAMMVELAVAGDDVLGVDRLEVERGGVSYTVDTLRTLREREPETEWTLVIGSDNLHELDQWREAAALPDLADIVVMTREGVDRPPAASPIGNRYTLVPVPDLEISSSTIRNRVAHGRSIRYWVPPAVEAYIRERGLYRGRESD